MGWRRLCSTPVVWYNMLMQDNSNVSLLRLFFRQKWVKIILCLNIAIVLVIIGIVVYNSFKTVTILFEVTPLDATISVNGNAGYSNGSYKLMPGTYRITISHDELDSKSFDLELPSNTSTMLLTYLSADNGNDFSFYEKKDNYNSAVKLIDIALRDGESTYDHDTSARQFAGEYKSMIDAFNNELPIIESLHESPEQGGRLLSTISIQENDSCVKYLCVSVSSFGYSDVKKEVNTLLEEAGFRYPGYLEIKYETN